MHGRRTVRTARGIETIDTTIVADVVPGDLVLDPRRHSDRRRSRERRRPTSCIRSSRPTSATRQRCCVDLAESARAKVADQRRAPQGRRSSDRATIDRARRAGDGATASRAAGGCSCSATAAAPPTPRRWPHLFIRPPWGVAAAGAQPGRRLGGADRTGQRRRLRPRVLAPVDRPRRRRDIAIGLSTSGNSRNLLVRVRRSGQARAAHDRHRRLLGRRHGRDQRPSHHCLVVDDDSVHRIQETQAALGFALWQQVQARLCALEEAQSR